VRLKEKELRDRFGLAYDEYRRRVPRFLLRKDAEVPAPPRAAALHFMI
jgi:hypothetical protein